MDIHVDTYKRVWLSYEYLKNSGITSKAIEHWKSRKIGERKYINGNAYINYDTIPEHSRKRILGKAALIYESKRFEKESLENHFFNQLNEAYAGISSAKWRNIIQNHYPTLKTNDLLEFGRRAAVVEKAIEINPYKYGNLEALYKAYVRIYEGSYSTKRRFCMALKKAQAKGIEHFAVDQRIFNVKATSHKDDVVSMAAYILNHNKAFDVRTSYEYLVDSCMELDVKPPSYNWLRNFYKQNKNTINKNRYGQSEYEKYDQIYVKIIPALYAGDQWQMDGWRIPIYCKRYNENGKIETFVTYNLFVVLDAHSRKIIGFCISETENTQSILKGIEMAVKDTLTLPYEIVADNHSFNKTKEAGNIKENFEKLGVTWTVDSNPRRKALLERAFRTLGDKYFKREYGYIGQGIKSRMKGGITQQELRDIYTRPENFLNYEQVVAITCRVIMQYNSTPIRKLNDCPNNLYENSDQPNSIKVDEFERIRLFTLKTECKVSHGQITIQRGGHKYEYQLPAKQSNAWNNQTVVVRYADYDTIYLYDPRTDQPICSVNQKFEVHGALANQTGADKENLFKNKGRTKGINARIKKQKQSWTDNGIIINPNAYETVNRRTTPKDLLVALQQNDNLRRMVMDQGVNPDDVMDLPKVNEMLDNDMSPTYKQEKVPFAKEAGTMQIINMDSNN